MNVGEPFNPRGLFRGCYIPDSMVRDRGLSAAAKLAWGRLSWFARDLSEDGGYWFSLGLVEFAGAIGVSERQSRRYLDELATAGYIERDQTCGQEVNRYRLLWSSGLEDSLRKTKSGRTDLADHSESGRTDLVPKVSDRYKEVEVLEVKRESTPHTPHEPTEPPAGFGKGLPEPDPKFIPADPSVGLPPGLGLDLTGSLQVVIGRHCRRLFSKARLKRLGTLSQPMLEQLERDEKPNPERFRAALVAGLQRFALADLPGSIGQFAFDWVQGYRAEHGSQPRASSAGRNGDRPPTNRRQQIIDAGKARVTEATMRILQGRQAHT